MCIVTAKYFEDIGWVCVKNRDRNYIPEISFKRQMYNDIEIMLFWDDVTKYCEGFNSAEICILSASLMVLDDEKEVTVRKKTPSKDGIKIKKALRNTDIKKVVQSLIDDKLPGNTIICNKETCYLLEGSWIKGGYKTKQYDYKLREIPHNQSVTRTNHGILLKNAGYQMNSNDKSESLSRISSESRRIIAKNVVKDAKTPSDIIDGLCQTWTNNPQLNCLRTATGNKQMRTTSQIMIIPSEKTMFIRPVQSSVTFNFWELNNPKYSLWIEILSNRILYKHKKDSKDSVSKMNHSV